MEDKEILKELGDMVNSVPLPDELSEEKMIKKLSPLNYRKEIRSQKRNRRLRKAVTT